jgi:hypothetical protein
MERKFRVHVAFLQYFHKRLEVEPKLTRGTDWRSAQGFASEAVVKIKMADELVARGQQAFPKSAPGS